VRCVSLKQVILCLEVEIQIVVSVYMTVHKIKGCFLKRMLPTSAFYWMQYPVILRVAPGCILLSYVMISLAAELMVSMPTSNLCLEMWPCLCMSCCFVINAWAPPLIHMIIYVAIICIDIGIATLTRRS